MLAVENLSLRLGNFALQNVDFAVDPGEYFVVLGLSGVGKSVLLEVIAGLLPPDAGTIRLRGREITADRIQRRNLSIVYQEGGLFPHLTVFENIAYPLRCRRQRRVGTAVREAAEQTGIADKLERRPHTLSGGECQRAALARSLAAGSDLFLLDEPLSALDAKSKIELRSLLRKLNRQGITIVHVTHDYEEAISLATRIGIMENGTMAHVGPPAEVFQRPKSEFIARFVGIRNYLKGEVRQIPGSDLKYFICGEIKVFCLTAVPDGAAYLIVRPDEISIANSLEGSSSRNHFQGRIVDIAAARLGVEVTVDVGIAMVATISADALCALQLEIGREVWVSFKASSCRVYS